MQLIVCVALQGFTEKTKQRKSWLLVLGQLGWLSHITFFNGVNLMILPLLIAAPIPETVLRRLSVPIPWDLEFAAEPLSRSFRHMCGRVCAKEESNATS